MKQIAFDFDDVIVETAPKTIKHYNQTYGTKVALNDFYSDDDAIWGANLKTAVKRVEAYHASDEFVNAPLLDGATQTLRKLHKHYGLHIVTGRDNHLRDATMKILDRDFSGIFDSVIFTGFFSDKPRTKAKVCQQLGIDIFIDDHLHHATTVAATGIEVLLFGNYPWNQSEDLPPNIRRVQDWNEVSSILLP
jgi:uncharacterized HAD superfamily protein